MNNDIFKLASTNLVHIFVFYFLALIELQLYYVVNSICKLFLDRYTNITVNISFIFHCITFHAFQCYKVCRYAYDLYECTQICSIYLKKSLLNYNFLKKIQQTLAIVQSNNTTIILVLSQFL